MEYTYCIKHKGTLKPYSGHFDSDEQALAWKLHPKKGNFLIRTFNRELILCDVDYHENCNKPIYKEL